MSGTLSCTVATEVDLFVSVRQRNGGRIVAAGNGREVRCRRGNKTTSWSVKLYDQRPFRAGDAGVFVTATAERKHKDKARIVSLRACGRCL